MKVRNLKSSNKKIAVPRWAYEDIDPNSFSKEVDVFCKKTGTAKISGSVYKDGKKLSSFSFKVKIYKYASPVKSFKIGKNNLAKKIKKEPAVAMKVTGSKKFKISVKANTGWKLKSLKLEKYTMEGKIISKKIKNGKTVKINGNDNTSIVAKLYNKKQGRYQEVQVLLSEYV